MRAMLLTLKRAVGVDAGGVVVAGTAVEATAGVGVTCAIKKIGVAAAAKAVGVEGMGEWAAAWIDAAADA